MIRSRYNDFDDTADILAVYPFVDDGDDDEDEDEDDFEDEDED